MFEKLEMAPPDPILGLTAAFNEDSNPKKVNLGVGVYKAEDGTTPTLGTVVEAEKRILEKGEGKAYLPIPGSPEYGAAVQALVFGEGHEIIARHRAATAHTPGGTGALRVSGDFIHQHLPGASLWLSDPTWANHPKIFEAAGLNINTYPYYDARNHSLAFDAMLEALKKVPAGDVVLFHGCCQNPTGMDPTPNQWNTLAEVARDRKFLPLMDFAYQGFADGIEEDAIGVRAFCTEGCELLIASSFSKNFGLYRERVGALTAVGATKEAVQKAFSHIKLRIRTNYSNPPAHGGAIVSTILADSKLRARWEIEVKEMRDRINGMRELFVKTLKAKGVDRDFSFLTKQRGMFSMSGLSKDQVQALKEKYSIYIVGSGRINVAGLTPKNIDYVCQAIKDVL